MAYSELIKNFSKIRSYMRDFYVYGFKSREEFTQKSSRSYDDERRRVASWLEEYMQFHQDKEGKQVFLSIDSRQIVHNPFYQAWKAKSFTPGDITLHFYLMVILSQQSRLSLSEIMDELDEILQQFPNARLFDESTIRKKLKEYVAEGLVLQQKQGRKMYYTLAPIDSLPQTDFLDFFAEVAPCGVIGSTILDKLPPYQSPFRFKHHYLTSALDSEILYQFLQAISQQREVEIQRVSRENTEAIVPLKILVSVQNGRQYLMAYSKKYEHLISLRLDLVESVNLKEECPQFGEYLAFFQQAKKKIWGVSFGKLRQTATEMVTFTIHFEKYEAHIYKRLLREKRLGTVELLDSCTARFSAEVYDSAELLPWIRTFICRITAISFSNPEVAQRFQQDLKQIYQLYGVE